MTEEVDKLKKEIDELTELLKIKGDEVVKAGQLGLMIVEEKNELQASYDKQQLREEELKKEIDHLKNVSVF